MEAKEGAGKIPCTHERGNSMTVQTQQRETARDYKSRMFVRIFEDKQKLLELYNAVSGRDYSDPELLTINTLENAIYMSMKNDLSFLIDSGLSLYEHQSTRNGNMPIRLLFYLSDLYSAMIQGKNLYGTKTILLPPPRFVVFYNGREEQPDHETVYLSDAYERKDEEVSLELKVDVLNINKGHNKKLMESCRTLGEYAEYVYRVREYAKKMSIESAVERTIQECIREDILREFLLKNRAEAKAMSIYEYNEEEHIRMEREEAFEDGRREEQKNTERERQRTEQERQKAEQERQRAEQERQRAEAAETKAAQLEEQLRNVREQLDRQGAAVTEERITLVSDI